MEKKETVTNNNVWQYKCGNSTVSKYFAVALTLAALHLEKYKLLWTKQKYFMFKKPQSFHNLRKMAVSFVNCDPSFEPSQIILSSQKPQQDDGRKTMLDEQLKAILRTTHHQRSFCFTLPQTFFPFLILHKDYIYIYFNTRVLVLGRR